MFHTFFLIFLLLTLIKEMLTELHTTLDCGAKAAEAINRLAFEVFSSPGNEMFCQVYGKAISQYDFVGIFPKETIEFQTEKIPDSFYAENEKAVIALVLKAS